MYPVSAEYLNEITQDGRRYFISGNIKLKDNTIIMLSEDTVMQGSLSLEEKIVSGADIEIGSVNISKLNLTLKTSPDDPYSLDGAVVSPVFNLQLVGGTEQVPLGIFNVSEVNRVVGGSIALSAYDNMAKLDKSILQVTKSGRPRDLILSICSVCGVELATNGTTFSTFPNYSVTLTIPDDSNIKSCRDLLMWICQTIGCSARFNRLGKLDIKLITGGASVKSIPPQNVYSETISDFMTKVTRLSTVNGDNEISVGVDGQALELSENPLYHNKTATQITTALTNVLNRLTLLEYVPAEISYIGDPALQAGDILGLEVEGGIKKIWVTSHIWRYGGKHTIKSEGSEYARNQTSQAEKSLQFVSKKAEKAQTQATLAEEKALELEELVDETRADFNSAISVLDGEMGSVTARVGNLESDITGIQAEYGYLHAEVTDVVQRMTTAETEIGVVAGEVAIRVKQDEFEEYVSETEGVITAVQSDVSALVQTASEIALTVNSHTGTLTEYGGRLNSAEAQLSVQASEIQLRVTEQTYNQGISAVSAQAQAAQTSASNAQTAADNANTAALNAAGIANSKGKVIYAASAPTGADRNVNNLWIRTSDNKPHTWSGTAWVARTDKAATDAASAAATAQTAASNAQSTANAAQAAAAALDTRLTSAESSIIQQADQIALRVTTSTYNAGMASKANQSALNTTNSNLSSLTSTVTLNASSMTTAFKTIGVDGYTRTGKTAIDIDGLTIYNGGVTVKNNAGTNVLYADSSGNLTLKGTVYATDGEFSGKITSTSGKIAGFDLTSTKFSKSTTSSGFTNVVELSSTAGFKTREYGSNAMTSYDSSVAISGGDITIKYSGDLGTGQTILNPSHLEISMGNQTCFLSPTQLYFTEGSAMYNVPVMLTGTYTGNGAGNRKISVSGVKAGGKVLIFVNGTDRTVRMAGTISGGFNVYKDADINTSDTSYQYLIFM